MTSRLRALTAAILVALAGLVVIALHARRLAQRAEDRRAANLALVDATGLGDLALSSSARWLRHPSQAEPAAAVQDVPAGLDVDPAGALTRPLRGSP